MPPSAGSTTVTSCFCGSPTGTGLGVSMPEKVGLRWLGMNLDWSDPLNFWRLNEREARLDPCAATRERSGMSPTTHEGSTRSPFGMAFEARFHSPDNATGLTTGGFSCPELRHAAMMNRR
jgi:hypothetical protein